MKLYLGNITSTHEKMKQKDFNITIDADELLNSYIWQAMRYISSRQSYVTTEAVNYAQLILANRDKFNPQRLAFFCGDVREQISQRVNWKRNVHVENYHNDICKYDAYSIIASYLEKLHDIEFADYEWYVDCLTADVDIQKREEPLMETGLDRKAELHDIDILFFIKLANAIDTSTHCKVTTKWRNEIEETIAIPHPIALQKWDKNERNCVGYTYHTVYCPLDRITSSAWIAPEYITEIEPLWQNDK